MLEEALNMHFSAGCYPTFQPVNGLSGGLLKIPENALSCLPKQEVLYETNNGTVTIYINGIKEHTINAPNYAIRCLVLCDIICKADNQGFSGMLVKPLKESGDPSEYLYEEFMSPKNSVDLIDIKMSKRERILEGKLNEAFQVMITYGEADVSPEIEEGFETIHQHYLREFQDNE